MTVTRIAVVVGARPEFVQAGALLRAIPAWNEAHPHRVVDALLIHSGQHYDRGMSQVFFDELNLPNPDAVLDVGSATHGVQTGLMMQRLDPVLADMSPDFVLVFGDTNTTLAGALTAAKLQIPVGHVEAGLRSFNMAMPEELNRRIVDHVASLLFCPSPSAVKNLDLEGIERGVIETGDVMHEAMAYALPSEAKSEAMADRYQLGGPFCLATVHRAENTDDKQRMGEILAGLEAVANEGVDVVLPLHPRTRNRVPDLPSHPAVRIIDPLGHPELLALASKATVGLTDSGGMQKELYWLSTPCVTLRDETEWVETLDRGWNVLAGASSRTILAAVKHFIADPPAYRPPLYGEDGSATWGILSALTANPDSGGLG